VARQTGVRNPLLPKMGEKRISSLGNNTVIILKSALCRRLTFGVLTIRHRIAPSVDLVLLSHGDLPHSGLYPYAYSRWGLKAPAYSTLPVQAMARIAATEETDGIRDEEDVGGAEEQAAPSDEGDAHMRDPSHSTQDNQMEEDSLPQPHVPKLKYVATPQEVHDSFDAINTLRYSQPAHLSGKNDKALAPA
jgi:cleavage and polyadenylation specificity factor subunit 2